MKGILTVGILMLTVFLLSAPAQAGVPYTVAGYADYSDGTPADGAVVTIYEDGEAPSSGTTAVVGESYNDSASGWWKVVLYSINDPLADGASMVVSIDDGDSNVGRTTFVVDTSSVEVHRVADVTLAPAETGSGGGGGGGSGTYPPGWGETKAAATGPAATSTDDTSSDSTGTGEKTVATGGGSTKGTTAGGSTDGTTEPTDDNASEDTGDTDKTTEMKTPGFGAFFAVVGMLAVAFMALQRRD